MPLFLPPASARDPRYRYIITLCNYFLATLCLGLVMLLSGIMAYTYVEQKKQKEDYDEAKLQNVRILGIILMVFGCLFFLASCIVFIVSSINYVRLRNSPPPDAELDGNQVSANA